MEMEPIIQQHYPNVKTGEEITFNYFNLLVREYIPNSVLGTDAFRHL
ncbi:hypothetical protein [Cecembia rubra]|nr:hypothetical protein [Cecembia rubra]